MSPRRKAVNNGELALLAVGAGLAFYGLSRGGGADLLEFVTVTARRVEPAPWMDATKPRGIRNNNPGNIEDNPANAWEGRVGSDGRYVVFSAPVWGIRAMAKVLDSYRARGVDTLAEIIGTWAPSHENDVSAYLGSVAQRSRLEPGQVITRAHYPALMAAMIYHENGQQPYSASLIREGIARA